MLFVRRVDEAPQERDRDRFDAERLELIDGAMQVVVRDRNDDLAGVVEALGDLEDLLRAAPPVAALLLSLVVEKLLDRRPQHPALPRPSS